MAIEISHWLNKKYPQNTIIRNPLIGTLIFLGFSICFVVIYKPLQIHESRFFSLEMTVAIYFIIVSVPLFGLIKILKRVRFFSNPDNWTLLKEIIFILFLLLGVGITVYFAGFLMESPRPRWNLMTLLNSVISSFLVGIVPFLFFTILNYRYLFVTDIIKDFNRGKNSEPTENHEEIIKISSQLKKEELEFYPNQLIYAESDGNYIVFYLEIENQVKKRVIRNSINNIEQQLSSIPFIFRSHRAFLVNVRRVSSQKGNSLGYRLKLSDTDIEIPVSRQKTREFDQLLKRYH